MNHRRYSDERTTQYQNNWERMRMLASIVIQPYSKKRITPSGLLPFPWEKQKRKTSSVKRPVSKEEALKRFEELMKRPQ